MSSRTFIGPPEGSYVLQNVRMLSEDLYFLQNVCIFCSRSVRSPERMLFRRSVCMFFRMYYVLQVSYYVLQKVCMFSEGLYVCFSEALYVCSSEGIMFYSRSLCMFFRGYVCFKKVCTYVFSEGVYVCSSEGIMFYRSLCMFFRRFVCFKKVCTYVFQKVCMYVLQKILCSTAGLYVCSSEGMYVLRRSVLMFFRRSVCMFFRRYYVLQVSMYVLQKVCTYVFQKVCMYVLQKVLCSTAGLYVCSSEGMYVLRRCVLMFFRRSVCMFFRRYYVLQGSMYVLQKVRIFYRRSLCPSERLTSDEFRSHLYQKAKSAGRINLWSIRSSKHYLSLYDAQTIFRPIHTKQVKYMTRNPKHILLFKILPFDYLALKITLLTFERSGNIYQSARCNIPEGLKSSFGKKCWCNAQRCITGKRWIDIWLVFISLDFEMRFDNFTRATCILYTDLVETLNFLLRYKFV